MPSPKTNGDPDGKAVKRGGSRRARASLKPSEKGRRGSKLALRDELRSLSSYIRTAKAQIAAIRPEEVKEEFLPSATDELDAITEAAAKATHVIMDAAEAIDEVAKSVDGKMASSLTSATTSIYEACGFQDITGQRITKVVTMLRNIEEKVDALVAVFEDDESRDRAGKNILKKKKNNHKAITDEDLLNGPQKKGEAKSQDEIDALLASFD